MDGIVSTEIMISASTTSVRDPWGQKGNVRDSTKGRRTMSVNNEKE